MWNRIKSAQRGIKCTRNQAANIRDVLSDNDDATSDLCRVSRARDTPTTKRPFKQTTIGVAAQERLIVQKLLQRIYFRTSPIPVQLPQSSVHFSAQPSE